MFQTPNKANRENVITNCRRRKHKNKIETPINNLTENQKTEMMISYIKYLTIFMLVVCVLSCQKRDTQVGYYVYVTKKYDSLPCQVDIEYPDLGTKRTTQISSDWSFVQKINHDQYVVLKATSVSNVKTLKVEIYAKENPVSESCSDNCTVSVRKDLYD